MKENQTRFLVNRRILSAGQIGFANILQLSGIGSKWNTFVLRRDQDPARIAGRSVRTCKTTLEFLFSVSMQTAYQFKQSIGSPQQAGYGVRWIFV